MAGAVAVAGMFVVNFSAAMCTGRESPPWLAWLVDLIYGKAAATFVVLAGIGLSLLSRRARETGDFRLLARNLLFNGFYPIFPWLSFLLVGMWLGRRDRTAACRRWGLILGGAAALAGAEFLSWCNAVYLSEMWPALDDWPRGELLGTGPMPPGPLFLLAGGGTAMVVIGICAGPAGRREGVLRRVLAATGRVSLTLYVGHVVVGMGALALVGRLDGHPLAVAVGYALGFFLASVGFASLWTRRFAYGPLEWIMRRISRPASPSPIAGPPVPGLTVPAEIEPPPSKRIPTH